MCSGVVTTKARVEQQSVHCRFHAFATPMIHAIQQLLPDNTCVEGVPGEDNDLYLALEDLEKMQPPHLNSMTGWLEKQVADVSRLAVSQVQCLRPLCLDHVVLARCCCLVHPCLAPSVSFILSTWPFAYKACGSDVCLA